MRTTILLGVLALTGANPYGPQRPALVIHVTHHPTDLNAARLADAVRKACAAPSMECRIGDPSTATTFLYVTVQSFWRRTVGTGEVWSSERPVEDPVVDAGGLATAQEVFGGFVDIKSRVMMPGSVDGRDESLETLGARLLASVRERRAEHAGVMLIDRDAR